LLSWNNPAVAGYAVEDVIGADIEPLNHMDNIGFQTIHVALQQGDKK
jgi:hypothetical protein